MILDIACGALLLLFGLIGGFRGLTRQLLQIVGWFIGIVGAFFLLEPVFELLAGFEFFENFINAIKDLFSNLKFFDEALTLSASLYVVKGLLFIVLWIVVSLLYKLIRRLITPISDLKVIRVFDKFFGAVLGLVFAAVIIVAVFFAGDKISAFGDMILDIAGDGLVKTYVLDNFDKVLGYLWGIIEFIVKETIH